jgi:pimeloyl-ACP methyl ester carboxylesterase
LRLDRNETITAAQLAPLGIKGKIVELVEQNWAPLGGVALRASTPRNASTGKNIAVWRITPRHLQAECRSFGHFRLDRDSSVGNHGHGDSPMETIKMSEEINHHRRRFLGTAAMTIATAQLAIIAPADAQPGKPAPAAAIKPGSNKSFGPLKQVDAGVLNVGYAEAGPADGPAVILMHGWPYDIHSFVDVAPLLASSGYRVIVPHLRGYGTTRFLSNGTFRNGQQSVVALDIIELMDALKIGKAILAGYDWGARTANIIAALWPERCKAMVSVNGYLINNRERNKLPLPPKVEWGWWYQYYFATERGRAGYEANRHEFAKLMWKFNSPKWDFDDATFDRSAASFDNPDHVSIVIHNYRWRLSLAEGDPKYDTLETQLAEGPVIAVPTITLDGDSDGVAPATNGASYAMKFSGKRTHRIIKGVGHNLPQEAPQAFAEAVVDVDGY